MINYLILIFNKIIGILFIMCYKYNIFVIVVWPLVLWTVYQAQKESKRINLFFF